MTTCQESPAASEAPPLDERRAGRELVLELVFRPLASALVPLLLRARVPPPAVVLANTVAGLGGALALARGELLLAAALVQVKTLLDNADGQLARATGHVTLSGRYLDTEADLLVNVALFLALADVTGQSWLALASFIALTLVLAVDFNMSELYREAHRLDRHAAAPLHGRVERTLGSVYRILFAPQDRAVRAFSRRRLERVVGGPQDNAVVTVYHDRATVTVLANLGLSTQLTVLGLCLVLDVPSVYLWLTIGCLALLPALQLRRERLTRRALGR